MQGASRTKRTLQNSGMALLLFLIQLAVGFYSRKVFLDYLGAEVLGLNTTLGNILSLMNLADLGIGIAIATSLYKPINDNDYEKICEIITVEGLFFRRVILAVLCMAMIVMCLIPYFFPNTECGLAYVYIAFLVFLFSSLSGYLWNYRQVLIAADQKNFKLLPWKHVVRYGTIGMQIVSLLILHLGFWGWIFWEFIGNVAAIFVINYVLKHEYPWLHKSKMKSKDLMRKYHDMVIKTKKIFVHKISYFVVDQAPTLIIYAFVSLVMVTYYANYMVIVGYMTTTVNIIYGSMGAAIGSLVAENNRRHTMDVFWEVTSSRIWIASLACFGIYLFMDAFIELWIGRQYVLSHTTLLLIVASAFVRMSRNIVDSFKEAYQLFDDVWAPVTEVTINLGGSILFGYLWGLNGILLGSNLSLLLMVLIWKPYYLMRDGMKESCLRYFSFYGLHIFIIFLCGYVAVQSRLSSNSVDGIYQLLWLVPSFLLYAVTSFVLLYLTTGGMRRFTRRVIRIIKGNNNFIN